MNEKVIEFKRFLEKNKEKIDAITPKNPTINEFEEGISENEWDYLFRDILKEN